jgi:hypothetical protein
VKLVRVLSRIVLLSLAAGAFVGLTGLYGRSIRTHCQIPSGRLSDSTVRPSRKSVSFQNSSVIFFCLYSGLG